MKFDELFEQRSLVASKLKDCIRDMGYTKVSFAAKADISRPMETKIIIALSIKIKFTNLKEKLYPGL